MQSSNLVWSRNRTLHAQLLLAQLHGLQNHPRPAFEPPFDRAPRDGPLPTLQPLHTYAFLSPTLSSPRSPPSPRCSSPEGHRNGSGGRGAIRAEPSGRGARSTSFLLNSTPGRSRATSGRSPSAYMSPIAQRPMSMIPAIRQYELSLGFAASDGRADLMEWRLRQSEQRLGQQVDVCVMRGELWVRVQP